MFTEHSQELQPCRAKHFTRTKQESTLKVLQIKTDGMKHGKRQMPLLYREGFEAQILQNASCFMHLIPTEISASQTPKCLEHPRCGWPGWPQQAPHRAAEVSHAGQAGMQGSLVCGARSPSPQECLPTDWSDRHTPTQPHLCSVSTLFL